ncbi:MAG TPA: hypothetical protein VM689_24590 [Aliidongia sp.]|nr:hypothetical protein [Aliidongia sp.]
MTLTFFVTRGGDRPAPLRIQRWWGIGLALLALSPAACAAASPLAGENPQQSARITHACSATMGFSPGTLDYTECVASLSQSVAGVQQARTTQAARSACVSKALEDGTPDFALCMLDHEQSQH